MHPLILSFVVGLFQLFLFANAATGDKYCSDLICVSAVLNSSTITYTLSSTGKTSPAGWMSIGFGTQMKNTEMVVLWANSDNRITLSNRKASGDTLPAVNPSPSRQATLLEEQSVTEAGKETFVFSVPANGETKQSLIYAFGGANPGNVDASSNFKMHSDMGTTVLDLTKALQTTSTGTSQPIDNTPSSSSSSNNSGADALPLRDYEKMIIAHGILCVIGFLLFLPAGALVARYLRTFTHTWYSYHWIIQFGVGAPLITAGVILGIVGVQQHGGMHLYDSHMKWGIVILGLYYLQCALGAIIHFFKPSNFKGRPPQNYVHAILGLAVIGLGLKQVGDGILEEWPKKTGRSIPNSARVIWILWIILLPCLYGLGLAFLPRQYRQEKANRRDKEQDEMKISMVGHGMY